MILKISNRLSVWSFSFLVPTWITTDYRLACLHLVMTLSHPAPFVLVSFPKNKRCEPHNFVFKSFRVCTFFGAWKVQPHRRGIRPDVGPVELEERERVIYVRTDIVIHPREKNKNVDVFLFVWEKEHTRLVVFLPFSLMIKNKRTG
jgi:hypothetical protein